MNMLAKQMSAADFNQFKDYLKAKTGKENFDDLTNTEIANATVLYVASKSKDMTAAGVLETLKDNGGNNINGVFDRYGKLPSAALMYGTMVGFANSNYVTSEEFKTAMKTPPKNIGDVLTLFNKMTSDPGVDKYMQATDKGAAADMDGYLGALRIINNYDVKFDVSNPNAFNDDQTLALLQAVLNSKK